MRYSHPLKIAVLGILKKQPESISIHRLFELLDKDLDILSNEILSMEVLIFRKNFLIMNTLYQLQDELLSENVYLSISSMDIKMNIIYPSNSPQDLNIENSASLKSYYLDWKNYNETGEDEINQLFANFWRRYLALDKQLEALNILQLSVEATPHEVEIAYRKSLSLKHPDKGGTAVEFIELREAYEILRQCGI